jgi:hypothetical protein
MLSAILGFQDGGCRLHKFRKTRFFLHVKLQAANLLSNFDCNWLDGLKISSTLSVL